MSEDRERLLLEQIAYYTEDVTPGDRLRALEQLRALSNPQEIVDAARSDLDGLDGAKLDGHLDSLVFHPWAVALLGEDEEAREEARATFPGAAAEVDHRLGQLVRAEVERTLAERYAAAAPPYRPGTVIAGRSGGRSRPGGRGDGRGRSRACRAARRALGAAPARGSDGGRP